MAAKSNRFRSALLASTSMLAGGSLLTAHPVSAQSILPTQGVVTSGVASIHQSGADLSVNQTTPRAIVNWGSFSIGQSNVVTFNQPNAFSAILNRVTGSTTSTIAGQLNANGQIYLVNPNGIAITRTGAVRVGGGFVASTLPITDDDFNSGNLSFTGQGASAAVSNAGTINAASGGFVGLLGGTVSNSGAISVPLGKVGLGSGEQATLNLTGDNFLQVALPAGAKTADGKPLVDVSGKVSAAGGSVQLKAATVATAIRDAVNVSGVVSARSARASGGSIILGGGPGGDVSVTGRLDASGRTKGGTIAIDGHNVALRRAQLLVSGAKGRGGSATVTGTHAVSLVSTTVDASGATGGGAIRIGGDFHGASDFTSAWTTTVDSASTLNASATASGDGGTVAVWSDASTTFAGRITATGGPGDGNGGYAEVSANPATHGILTDSGFADLTAPKGTTGTLLLDPFDITICADCDEFGGSFSGGVYTPTATSAITASTLETQLTTANVLVSTGLSGSPGTDAGNLTVSAPVTWASAHSLTLTAASELFVDSAITSTGGGSLTLNGGLSVNISSLLSTATGGITVTGPAFLSANVTTAGGPITFNNPVTLDATLTINSGAGTTTFGGTVDSGPTGFSSTCGAGCDLTVSGGVVSFDANVGSGTPLGALNASGLVNLGGNVTTNDGAITFNNAVALGADATVNSGAAITTFAGTVDGGHLLTVAGGVVNFDANVGSSTPLGGLSVTGPVNLSGNVTTNNGPITFNGAVGLDANVTLNSGTATTTFGSTVDSSCLDCDAPPAVNLTATAGAFSFAGALGGINPLGAVSLTSTSDLTLPAITATALTAISNAGGILLEGAVDPLGSVALTAAGDVVETLAASITASTLTATSTAGKVVMTSFNNVSTVSGSAPQGFSFSDNGDFSVGGITTTTGSIFLWADGDGFGTITQTGPIVGPALVAEANTDVILNTAANSVATVGGAAVGEFVFGNAAPTLTIGPVSYYISSRVTPVLSTFSPGGISGAACDSNCPASVVISNAGNLVLSPGSIIDNGASQSLPSSGNVVLAATGNFTNDAGAGAVSTPNGNWQIYSATPFTDTFGGLDSGETAVWDTTFRGTVAPTSVNRYLFAFQPVITVTSGNVSKTYGQDVTSLVATDYTITGLQLADPSGAYLGDTLSGAPAVTSLGSPARASVAGSPYPITVGQGSLVIGDGYAFAADSAGLLSVSPLPLTYAVANATGIYGTTATLGAATLTGVLPGDVVDAAVGAFLGSTQITLAPTTNAGSYTELVTGLSNSNYSIASSGNTSGTLTIRPLPLTASLIGTVEKTYDGTTTAMLNSGNYSLAGFIDAQSATVTQTSGTYASPEVGSGIGVSATLPPGDFAAAPGTLLTNYVLPSSASGNVGVIDPKPLTFAVANALGIFGTTATLGAATLFGIVPGDVVDPTVGAFSGPIRIIPNPLTPPGAYLQDVTALSNPDYSIAASGNLPGVLTIINSPELSTVAPGLVYPGSQLQSGLAAAAAAGAAAGLGFKSAISCDAGPLLSAPRLYSNPANAVKALSNMVSQFIEQCERPTQANVADALDQYADALAKVAPSFSPELRNLPTIVHEAARRVRAAPNKAAAVAVLRETVATIRKEISLVRSEDPDVQSRQIRDGEAVAETLTVAGAALVNSGGL